MDISVFLRHISQLSDDGAHCDYNSRDAIVSQKYRDLCAGKKAITIVDLAQRFHPEELPFVQSEQYSTAEALHAFKMAFPQTRKSHEAAMLRQPQFSAFLVDIGASISDDSYFQDVVNCFY